MAKVQAREDFALPPCSGSNLVLDDFFPGKKVDVDVDFERFIRATMRDRFETRASIHGWASPTQHGPKALGSCCGGIIGGNEVCVLLVYLGSSGESILAIPEGAKEMNVVLGHFLVPGGGTRIAYVEHEVEDGVERICLRARPPEHVEDDPVKVIFFVK